MTTELEHRLRRDLASLDDVAVGDLARFIEAAQATMSRASRHRRQLLVATAAAVVAVGVFGVALVQRAHESGAPFPPIGTPATEAPDISPASSTSPQTVHSGAATSLPEQPGTAGPPPTAAAEDLVSAITAPSGTVPLANVRGVVDLASSCQYIETNEGRSVVIWPPGTRWSESGRLIMIGDLVIDAGSTVEGGGGCTHWRRSPRRSPRSPDKSALAWRWNHSPQPTQIKLST